MSEEYSLNIIAYLPLNARHIYDVNEDIVCGVSFVMNALMAVVLITENNEILRPYARVLLQNCACDVYYTLVAFLIKPKLEYYKGAIVIISDGVTSRLPQKWLYAGVAFYLHGMLLSVFVIPVVFYLRYSMLVRKVNLTLRKQLIVLALLVAWSAILVAGLILSMLDYGEDRESVCRKIYAQAMWTQDGAIVSTCVLSTPTHPLIIAFYLLVGVTDTAMYAVMIYWTMEVFAALKRARPNMRDRTARLHGQMNMLLVVQLISPTITAMFPLALGVMTCILHLVVPGIGLLIFFMLSWVPLVNPCITILLVSNYRRKCMTICGAPFRKLFCNHKIFHMRSSLVSSTSAAVAQANALSTSHIQSTHHTTTHALNSRPVIF